MSVVSGEAECPICGTIAASFEPGGHPDHPRPDCKCPGCGSLERHRALWLILAARTGLFHGSVRMLHVAPDRAFAARLRSIENVHYVSADLDPARGAVATDLTHAAFRDATFDVIIASHVLEHIPDDAAAMHELRRMLRPDGTAILAVPMWGPSTDEDLTVTDPAERHRRYGQRDHVRMYGRDGVFAERLRAAGFRVEVDPLIAEMDSTRRRRYRVRAMEPIYCCT